MLPLIPLGLVIGTQPVVRSVTGQRPFRFYRLTACLILHDRTKNKAARRRRLS